MNLATPSCLTSLPFLWLEPDAPERIQLTRHINGCSTFEFMGRSKMTELLSTIRGLRTALPQYASTTHPEAHFMKLLIYGTPGWGKSYMMAAAAVILRRDFFDQQTPLRVVYLPDCGQLREDPINYMKTALLLAFAENLSFMKQIHLCSTVEQLITFCQTIPKTNSYLLFLADQTNKLTAKNTDPVKKQEKKDVADSLLHRASFRHFLIEAISINDSNKDDVQEKQENRKLMPMFGELSQVR